jgi:serine/threonine protein kinase
MAAALVLQTAEGLHHAHQNGIVHHDIKPANLLVDFNGNLSIGDFGLASVRGADSLGLPGEVIGTLRYMSPEQAKGKPELVDHRTDIYSLGVTFYELLTLTHMFEGHDRDDLLHKIANQEPQRPRLLNHSIPVGLEAIVLRAVAKNAHDRYATTQEFATDIRRLLESMFPQNDL